MELLVFALDIMDLNLRFHSDSIFIFNNNFRINEIIQERAKKIYYNSFSVTFAIFIENKEVGSKLLMILCISKVRKYKI